MSNKITIICQNCGKEKSTIDPDKIFCCIKCQRENKKKILEEKRKNLFRNCKQCKKEFKARRQSHIYCSRKCLSDARSIFYDMVCQLCGKKFQVRNIFEIKRGEHKFCSYECSHKKYHFDEVDFLTNQDSQKIYWLGFLFASVHAIDDEATTVIDTDYMIGEFTKYLNSTIPIIKKDGISKLNITSRNYSRYLKIIGITTDFYQEAPILQIEYIKDFIRGFFDSHRGFIYKDNGENVVALHGKDSKLMRWMADMLDARIVYKNKEWVVICRNFEIDCNGLPRNKLKWRKFQNSPKLL